MTSQRDRSYSHNCSVLEMHWCMKYKMTLQQEAPIHQVTTVLATSKINVLFPGHNHLQTICTDAPLSLVLEH